MYVCVHVSLTQTFPPLIWTDIPLVSFLLLAIRFKAGRKELMHVNEKNGYVWAQNHTHHIVFVNNFDIC